MSVLNLNYFSQENYSPNVDPSTWMRLLFATEFEKVQNQTPIIGPIEGCKFKGKTGQQKSKLENIKYVTENLELQQK